MYILGDLIVLNTKENDLPLPWWNRAPLAFETDTPVFVDIIKTNKDRPGDLIVSVLDSNHRDSMIIIKCHYDESPGVMHQIFDIVSKANLNIALAESVTINAGSKHELELICESKDDNFTLSSLQEELQNQGFDISMCEILSEQKLDSYWQRKTTVESGWLKVKGWKKEIEKQLSEIKMTEQFDLTRVVISADTNNRILRYVFPKKGAINVRINHADDLGVLAIITNTIKKAGFNILSSLLKRGGVISGNAVLIAICEPTNLNEIDIQNNLSKIENELNKLEAKLRIEVKIRKGRSAENVIYITRKNSYILTPPKHLEPRIFSLKENQDKSKKQVFLSQRFLSDSTTKISQEVKRVLNKNNVEVVQALVGSGGVKTTLDEVSSAMWASNAGIVLVSNPDNNDKVAFSINLAHEFGFFHGQAKPLLLLVQNDLKVLKELDDFSNLKGITAPRFSADDAFKREHSQRSIESLVEKWLIDFGLINAP